MNDSVLIGVGALNAALALGLVPALTVFMGRMAFRELDEDDARKLLRAAFPVYYKILLAFTAIAALALVRPYPIDAAILGGVAFVTLYAWIWLAPIAHRLDDLKRDGQDVGQEVMRIQARMSLIVVAKICALATVVIRLATLPAPA